MEQIVWEERTVKNFWNYMSQETRLKGTYFTHQVGEGLIEFLKTRTQLKDQKVCDYGCGNGSLIDHLLKENSNVFGVDFSPESVEIVASKYEGRIGWGGVTLGEGNNSRHQDEYFDIVICCETIEHVLDQHLAGFFAELKRITRIGGIIIFTTPNNEELSQSMSYCPNCDLTFHKMQHVRSWNRSLLEKFLVDQGLSIVSVDEVRLKNYQAKPLVLSSIVHVSLADIIRFVKERIHYFKGRKNFVEFLNKVTNHKPNLIAIAKR